MGNPKGKWAKHRDVQNFMRDIENEYLVDIMVGFRWASRDKENNTGLMVWTARPAAGSDVPRGTYVVSGRVEGDMAGRKVDLQQIYYLTRLMVDLQIARTYGTSTLSNFTPPILTTKDTPF
jgi:hypothetical protein